MSFDDIDKEFKRIIQKADRIFTREQIRDQRIYELTAAREKDGRYRIAIDQTRKEITDLTDRINKATQLYDQHRTYFEIIFDPTIDQADMLSVLKAKIPSYEEKAREIYFPAMDQYHSLVGQMMSQNELEEELIILEKKLEKLENLREMNQELITVFLSNIDKKIGELE